MRTSREATQHRCCETHRDPQQASGPGGGGRSTHHSHSSRLSREGGQACAPEGTWPALAQLRVRAGVESHGAEAPTAQLRLHTPSGGSSSSEGAQMYSSRGEGPGSRPHSCEQRSYGLQLSAPVWLHRPHSQPPSTASLGSKIFPTTLRYDQVPSLSLRPKTT